MEKRSFAKELTKILIKQKVLSEAEGEALAKSFAESPKEYFDEFLLEEGIVLEEYILNAMSAYYQVPVVDVTGYFFETFLLHKFPKDVLHRNAFIPMAVDENIMIVVANEPDDPQLLSIIGDFVSYDIQFHVGIRLHITDAISEYYDPSDTEVLQDEDLRTERLQERGVRSEELDEEEEFPFTDEDVID